MYPNYWIETTPDLYYVFNNCLAKTLKAILPNNYIDFIIIT